jgi:hypothetical protein
LTQGNSNRRVVIEASVALCKNALCKKELDRIGGPTLYKNARAKMREGEDQMMMTWTQTEHTAKRQPSVGMRGAVRLLSLSLSPINTFGGGLGQKARSIDSRHIRH